MSIELQNLKAEWINWPPLSDEHHNLFEIEKTYGSGRKVKLSLTRAEAKEVARIVNDEGKTFSEDSDV